MSRLPRPRMQTARLAMLFVSDLAKTFGEKRLFEGVNFVINRGERAGLVGPNGCGKTTLLRLILGLEHADKGSARFSVPMTRVGYLPQAFTHPVDATVRDILLGEALEAARLAVRLQQLAEMLSSPTHAANPQVENEYAAILERMAVLGPELSEHELEEILNGLNLAGLDLGQPVAILSGGKPAAWPSLFRQPAFLILMSLPTTLY